MKNILKNLVASALVALPLTYQTSNAQSLPPQTPPPYDLRISGRVLDDQNQETRDLTPGQTYTLEILAENPFGTNSTVRAISFGFPKPKGITNIVAIQPSPYYGSDLFEGLDMNSSFNEVWTDGELLTMHRRVLKTETRPAKKEGILAKYNFVVNPTEFPTSQLFLVDFDKAVSDGVPPNMRPLKTEYRELLTATIPENLSTNLHIFYDSNNGETPAIKGKVPSPYVSAPHFKDSNIILEGSADLQNWTPLHTNTTGSFEFTDLDSINHDIRFYRVRKE